MQYRTLSPATEALIESYPLTTEAEMDLKLRTLAQDQETWARVSAASRCERLRPLGKILQDRRDEFAEIISLEMGKPISQARAEIEKCAALVDYYCTNAPDQLAAVEVRDRAFRSFIELEPLGIILGIMPWNFPWWQTFRFMIPTILAGNAILLKLAPNVPASALAIEAVMKSLELPYENIFSDSDQVEKLFGSRSVHGISFTGSVETGRHLASMAGYFLKKGVYELGGSDPYIVLDDADVAKAVRVCAAFRTINTGQSCIAAKRFIVSKKLRDSFESAFVSTLAEMKFADPMKDATLGPLARDDIRKKLHDQVTESIAGGARCLTGGTIPDGEGYFYPATVLTDFGFESPVWRDETFGPVAAVVYFDAEEEAIQLANDSTLGLGSAVFSENQDRALAFARKVRSGVCHINEGVFSDPAFPFGGILDSGYGRELGREGIHEFVNVRAIRGVK